MKIVVFNSGSSTLKFQLIESGAKGEQRKLARGTVDRIGGKGGYRFAAGNSTPEEKSTEVRSHDEAGGLVIQWLQANGLSDIDAAGHRVVHGGETFIAAVLIDHRVVESLEALCELAPLHNPGALSGIRAARMALGASLPMVAVFDTAFHRTLPRHAAAYAIPAALAEKYAIRRYGFHGLAHQYDLARYAELQGPKAGDISAVTLHLGNGCSATAIRDGQSIDTSMGFSPLEGLVMGTRSGDLDPALVSFLARKESVDAAKVEDWLNHRSGLSGLSGRSGDMRELIAAYPTDPRARLAVDVFCYRARKYLGAYLAVLDGTAEAVIFSGGIGENSAFVRSEICRGMEWCGMKLDAAANEAVTGRDSRISNAGSRPQIWVIHCDEEAVIAEETARLIGDSPA